MTPSGSLPPGAAVGSFTVEALIGRGGMGEVYRAVHRDLGRPVALKLLLPVLAVQEEFAARFVREARAVQSLGVRGARTGPRGLGDGTADDQAAPVEVSGLTA